MSKIGGKVGAKAMAFKMLLDRHSVDRLTEAWNSIQRHLDSESHYLRRFFYRDSERLKMKKVDGEFRLVHEQDVIGCLCAVKVDGLVYVGHSHCHSWDSPNKLVGAYLADLQAGMLMENGKADPISSQFKTKDVEDFMARCVKYFKVDRVCVKMWSFDDKGARYVRDMEVVLGKVADKVEDAVAECPVA